MSVSAAGSRLSPSIRPISIYERSAAKTISARNPAKQDPGSITAMRLREVTSMRFNVRFQ